MTTNRQTEAAMTKREERARRMRAYELAKSVAAANFADCTDEEQLDVVEEILAFADAERAEALREAAARILDTTSRGSAHEGLILANRVVNDMADRLTPAAKPAPVTYRAGTVPPVVRVGMVLRNHHDVVVEVLEMQATFIRWRIFGTPLTFEISGLDAPLWPLARDWPEPAAARGGSEAAGECAECDGDGHDCVSDDSGGLMTIDCPTCKGSGRGERGEGGGDA